MIKRLVLVAAVALVCAGCFGSAHNSEQCREWEFNGERLCQNPETDDIRISFAVPTAGDMEDMLVEMSPDDAATNRLEETTPIIVDDEFPTVWRANIVRSGPGVLRVCFSDGLHIKDPSSGLAWQILKVGECRVLGGNSFSLSRAVWE